SRRLEDKMLHFTLDNGHCWTTRVVLPSWIGFQSRQGAYGSQDAATPSDGSVLIVFAPEGRGPEPLTGDETSMIAWTIENERMLSGALISGLTKEYPALQKQYPYSGAEKDELMPDIKSADDLRSLIGLYAVNIHQVQKDGIPYVGFEFGCTWD